MVVAAIDKDYDDDSEGFDDSRVGKVFEYEAMKNWYGFDTSHFPPETDFSGSEKVRFRLKDDDGITYYGGWLYNDSEAIVQQFVLRWAESDVGATEIQVRKMLSDEWVTEIG